MTYASEIRKIAELLVFAEGLTVEDMMDRVLDIKAMLEDWDSVKDGLVLTKKGINKLRGKFPESIMAGVRTVPEVLKRLQKAMALNKDLAPIYHIIEKKWSNLPDGAMDLIKVLDQTYIAFEALTAKPSRRS